VNLFPSPTDSFAGKILDFVNPVTVTEALKTGWSTIDVSCQEFNGGLGLGRITVNNTTIGTAVPFTPASATVTFQEGAVARCTFTNQQSPFVTAADVSVEGHIVSSLGTGLSRVAVRLFDANTGETRFAATDSFGYFRFSGLTVGDFYTLNASSKTLLFPDGEVSFNLNDNLTGITLIGYERPARAPVDK